MKCRHPRRRLETGVRMGYRGPWELYDMKKDRTELHDVSADHPDMAKELLAKWQDWAVRTHVKPFPPRPAQAGNRRRKPLPRPAPAE